jgi:glycosyltransferase involved in cell wall biosynthesis
MRGVSLPLMSVVMPVYNASQYLDQAVESVLTQGVESLELLCIDEGSNDLSGEMLNAWTSRDKRVRLLKQQNAGLGAARNCGLDHSSGDYVVFVDADDLLLPGALKRMLAAAGESDVLVYNFIKFRGSHDPRGNPVRYTEQAKIVPRNDLLRMMGVVWNKLVRRRWLEKAAVRFPEGSLYEDIPVHWKLIVLAERIQYLASPLYALRVHVDSTTARAAVRRVESVKAFRMVEEFLRTCGKWDEYREVFLPCQLRNLARVYDSLSELGAESIARAAIEANLGEDQRAALQKLPLPWRDRDVFSLLEGRRRRIPKMRRQAFRQCRRAFRLLKTLLTRSH